MATTKKRPSTRKQSSKRAKQRPIKAAKRAAWISHHVPFVH